jgi:hypothetical protein
MKGSRFLTILVFFVPTFGLQQYAIAGDSTQPIAAVPRATDKLQALIASLSTPSVTVVRSDKAEVLAPRLFGRMFDSLQKDQFESTEQWKARVAKTGYPKYFAFDQPVTSFKYDADEQTLTVLFKEPAFENHAESLRLELALYIHEKSQTLRALKAHAPRYEPQPSKTVLQQKEYYAPIAAQTAGFTYLEPTTGGGCLKSYTTWVLTEVEPDRARRLTQAKGPDLRGRFFIDMSSLEPADVSARSEDNSVLCGVPVLSVDVNWVGTVLYDQKGNVPLAAVLWRDSPMVTCNGNGCAITP